MNKKVITVRIIKRNNTNREYPKNVLLSAIKNAQPLIDGNKLLVANKPQESFIIPLIDTMGVVKKLTLKDDGLYADILFINTPAYKVFEDTLKNMGRKIDYNDLFSSIGLGNIKKNKRHVQEVQSGFELWGVYLK